MIFYYLKIQVPEEVRITEEVRMMGKGLPAYPVKSLSTVAPAAFMFGSHSKEGIHE